MKIKPASPMDMDDIYMMGFDVWGEGENKETYLEQCRTSPKYKRGKWFVLETSEGERVCSLITYALEAGVAGVGSIATIPKERRKGYATHILKAILNKFSDEGTNVVYLYSDIAPQLYERLGFQSLPSKFQKHPGSTCMVRGISIEQLAATSGYQPPSYF